MTSAEEEKPDSQTAKVTVKPRQGEPFGFWFTRPGAVILFVLLVVGMALIWLFARPLALVILSVAIAAALSPLVYLTDNRILRVLIILLIILVLLALLGVFSWIIIPIFIEQVSQAIDRLPTWIDQLEDTFSQMQWVQPAALLEMLENQLSNIGSSLLSVPLTLANIILDVVFTLVVTVYLLIEAPRMRRFVLSLFPGERRKNVSGVLNHIASSMGGYVRGTAITALLVGLITYVGLLIIGVNYPLMLGTLAAMLEVIPTIGPIIAAIPMIFFALQESLTTALIVLVFVIVLQQLESNIILPNIMRTQITISPLTVVLAIIAGGSIGGLLGVLAAIPLAAGLTVIVREVIAPAIRRRTGAADEAVESEEPEEGEPEEAA